MSYLCSSFEDVCDFIIAVNLFMYIDNAILITIDMSDITNSDKLPLVEKGISIVAIKDLEDCNFRVPNYQRGYRWTRQQVKDIIDDIFEFTIKFINNGQKGIYCIQPLVVQKSHNEEGKDCWDVIDGQQRLTTIFVILQFFNLHLYGLQYQTRVQSADYLNNLADQLYTKEQKFDNVDFYHMHEAFEEVSSKLKGNKLLDKFEEVLLLQVKFIWYAIDGSQNPIDVFTRLNIDKISLTPSELIKALLLNRNNFSSEQDFDKIHMCQQEIASEWDAIENQLQMENFWLFFHDVGYHSATRIDYLFEILCEQKMLGDVREGVGNDGSRTFRYVYAYFKSKGYNRNTIQSVWEKVKSIFDTLNEWYNDLELYHYVGYLLSRPNESTRQAPNSSKMKETIYRLWGKWVEKDMMVSKYKVYLHDEIQKLIDGCRNIDKEYETKGCPKTQCRPILLLHNILTVIRQGKIAKETYAQDIFFKFPFNLYKLEKWDVEHIDSNTTNDLQEFEQQKEWLLNNYVIVDEELKEKIQSFCEDNEKEDSKRTKVFESLRKKLQGSSTDLLDEDDKDNEKNHLWNFVLLDEKTNRGYGNAIFPAKRRIIIGKEQGKYYPCPKCNAQHGFEEIEPINATSSFILPCTKQVFMKYYSPASGIMTAWTRSDAKAYRQNIIDLLNEFDFKIDTNDE